MTTRRRLLKAFGALAVAGSCGPLSAGIDGGSGGGAAGGAAGGGAAGGGAAGGVASGTWASGTTALLTGKNYGNPFAGGVGPTCTVYKDSTRGPCHAPSVTRRDVSEGITGLPMRLELLVVNASCQPIPNAQVEIWMCDVLGVYSGDIDGNMDSFCTSGSATAAAASWGRGIQTAGSDGRVTFDSYFPGWYGGRATHIHFEVSGSGFTSKTSQLFFDDAFKAAIYDHQPGYLATSGPRYVPNSADMVISESALSLPEVVCQTAMQGDGNLLAWKAITVA